ncbi:hypothetical protein ABIB34_000433 [Rhodococcus sp. UYP5]
MRERLCGTQERSATPTPVAGSPTQKSPKPPSPHSLPPHTVAGRLIVGRVKDARYRDALFPVWRYHPFFNNTTLPTTIADVTHGAHAIIETAFSHLIDDPAAHMPSGSLGANSAWVLCAAIAHNLLQRPGLSLAARSRGLEV